MATYYDIGLTGNIPQGSNILNQSCAVVFTYPGGSHSDSYSGTIFSWPTASTVRISSAYLNIDSGWAGANGGTLTINTSPSIAFGINAFAKVP